MQLQMKKNSSIKSINKNNETIKKATSIYPFPAPSMISNGLFRSFKNKLENNDE